MDAGEGPAPANIIAKSTGTESGIRLVEFVLAVDSEGVLVWVNFVANLDYEDGLTFIWLTDVP